MPDRDEKTGEDGEVNPEEFVDESGELVDPMGNQRRALPALPVPVARSGGGIF